MKTSDSGSDGDDDESTSDAFTNNTDETETDSNWTNTTLRTSLQSSKTSGTEQAGEIFSKFPTEFTNDIATVIKTYDTGSGNGEVKTTDDTFFLLSYSEIASDTANVGGTYSGVAPAKNAEGTSYDYFKAKKVLGTSKNTCLAYATRAGNYPANSTYWTKHWWLRSPHIEFVNDFLLVYPSGNPASNSYEGNCYGVVPAFCLGKTVMHTVNFKNTDDTDAEGLSSTEIENGCKLNKPTDPKQTGSVFVGWYKDKACTAAFDFDTPITQDTVLYAKWATPLPENKINVTVPSEGFTYTGSAFKPDVSIEGLVKGTDFEVVYGENKNAGSGACTVTVNGIGVYGGSKVFSYDIAKATPVQAETVSVVANPGETLADIVSYVPSPYGGVEGSWEWLEDGSTSVGNNFSTSIHSAKFCPSDSDNYNSVKSVSVSVEVQSAFWLATAGQSDVSEAAVKQAVENDTTNSLVYKADSDVLSDVAVLKDTTHQTYSEEKYNAVKAEYEKYMAADGSSTEVHLYTSYGLGANDLRDGDGSVDHSQANKFAEFRIIQVGQHQYDTDSSHLDGSVLTFCATHLLPCAYQMNDTNTNYGGWFLAKLRPKMQKGGEIYAKFKPQFTNAIKQDTVKSNNISKNSSQSYTRTTNDSFFVLSYTEIASESSNYLSSLDAPVKNSEGCAYTWFVSKNIDGLGNNYVLYYYTRGGQYAYGDSRADSFANKWWLRSPEINNSSKFITVVCGYPWFDNDGDSYTGVVPAFCF